MGDFGLGGMIKDTMPGVMDKTMSDVRTKFGDLRKAGAILSGNPLGAIAAELIFPPSTAHGTLESEIKRGGFK